MKKIIICILMLLPFFTNAQKIKLDSKTNQVTVDGLNSFKIDRSGCGLVGAGDCHFDVYDIDSNKVMRINYKDFKSAMEVNRSNPDGNIMYAEFIFLASKTKAEVTPFYRNEEKMAKFILKNNLIVNGKLNDKAVEEFVLVHGTAFSERASRNR
jgi:hypothetical protein